MRSSRVVSIDLKKKEVQRLSPGDPNIKSWKDVENPAKTDKEWPRGRRRGRKGPKCCRG